MKIEQLVIVVIAGVILADLIANAAGTTSLFRGFGILWDIGTQPTNTSLLSSTMANRPTAKPGPPTLKA